MRKEWYDDFVAAGRRRRKTVMPVLTAYEAIEYAEANGLTLSKYNDPVEDAREGLTPAEARKVASEDASLIYLDSGAAQMTILSHNRGREVELKYGANIADLVRAIEAAGAVNEDGVIQAGAAVGLFPGRRELHTTMTEYSALVAAGCVPVVDEAAE